MQSPSGLVIGTAGHIDHGKTSLVRALTGIDTDRLAEEKKRGISIDLGFAHMTLPDSGERISFVDVPGHERFIKNMLAGVAGIDAVLLTVAADESVKPQTQEHFDICRLLQVRQGMVVLTKIDLASPEQIVATLSDIQHLVHGSFLEGAPVVQVSAKTGSGLAELKQLLVALSRTVQRRDATGYARLPVDRSFALKGFGTVVTGTLWTGTLRVGDLVLLQPLGREMRIRGLQVHGRAVDEAHAGERSAVNLTGIEHEEIRRGFTLTSRAELECSTLLDAEIEWLHEDEIPTTRQKLFLHTGTAEVMANVKLIAPGKPYVRLRLSEPVFTLPGDRLILRRPSPADTVAGGFVLDAFPRPRMNRARVLERCNSLARAGLNERLQLLVEESKAGQSLPELVRLTGATPERIKSAIAQSPALVYAESSHRVVGKRLLDHKRRELIEWLARFHAANPAAAGAPIAEARRKVDPTLAGALIDHDPAIVVRGDVIALAAHKPRVSSGELNALMQLERAFREAGFHPPSVDEILRATDPDAKKARGMLESLIKTGRLVRLSPDLVYHADVIAHVRKSLAAHKGRKFSVPEFKEWTQISRKYAIPLLEYLDRVHVTKRDGDSRVVL
jgi:selenocysteine-specific elongation factor